MPATRPHRPASGVVLDVGVGDGGKPVALHGRDHGIAGPGFEEPKDVELVPMIGIVGTVREPTEEHLA